MSAKRRMQDILADEYKLRQSRTERMRERHPSLSHSELAKLFFSVGNGRGMPAGEAFEAVIALTPEEATAWLTLLALGSDG